ncbi:Uncharacterised protein [Slackia heliotrinireducens]|uniref:Uncharacterized protein n=1 Tax=Slackia heliotrinireducens (strain ATCC 29202 / DSM 20476 / NCTC 11029 / RHS 1) TaxID=471855 RepID=C7N3C4_SLAHD|nr:hypothetical protein [Slackia heliotrinireducens]ACV23647.1 hypothetical protein Shel_26450 [Slackia heliotrinireducens DSM 20476]VEH03162.1 Uncharacterised protein [Slackia heliotrinireducens]
MAKSENMFSLTLNLDNALFDRMMASMEAAGVKNRTQYIRDAIERALDAGEADPELARVAQAMDGLNAEGRAWLVKCAELAAESESFRR